MSVQLECVVFFQRGLRQVRMESRDIVGAIKTVVPDVFPGISESASWTRLEQKQTFGIETAKAATPLDWKCDGFLRSLLLGGLAFLLGHPDIVVGGGQLETPNG